MKLKSYRLTKILSNLAIYFILTFFALGDALSVFLHALHLVQTCLPTPSAIRRACYRVTRSQRQCQALMNLCRFITWSTKAVSANLRLPRATSKLDFTPRPDDPETTYERRLTEVSPTGGAMNQQTVTINGEEEKLFDVTVDGQVVPMFQVSQTTIGEFVDPTKS